ncbi:MAG: anhydro-N-acetylmuramic acid kinase [Acidobacteriia bacterium]|nr:anhydro-N-acetylmuramic acid kinase [Terriglobia bacterium]
MRIAGVMSGTSLDGIDVAIVEVGRGRRRPKVQTIGFQSTPYPEAVRAAILEVSGGTDDRSSSSVNLQRAGRRPAPLHRTGALSALNFHLGELFARAVLRAVRRYGPIELIGCHGQTVYHEGGAHTLQIGEPAIVAERTGVPVVSNFRARDIAAGGQGAPLVPYVDYLLFRHPKRARIALNIGGIANITAIPPGAAPEEVVAFDTGPGNMVIDALARDYSKGMLHYDDGGKIALSGRVNRALLDELLADPYYRRKPPKSAGREQYGAEFIARLKRSRLPLRDLIATATVLTAATIAMGATQAITQASMPVLQTQMDLIVSGGGVHNPQIIAHLTGFLPGVAVSTSTDHGIDADAKEAIAFAILACETWRRKPSTLPSATGARRSVVLGSITP